jgi:hypothetical protein
MNKKLNNENINRPVGGKLNKLGIKYYQRIYHNLNNFSCDGTVNLPSQNYDTVSRLTASWEKM